MKQKRLKDGVKFDNGKPRYDLIPIHPLNELAKLYTFGAEKYQADNWRKGLKWSRAVAALYRHVTSFWSGETHDPETGQHHLVHAAFCCFTLIEFEQTRPEFDDRPKGAKKSEEPIRKPKLPRAKKQGNSV